MKNIANDSNLALVSTLNFDSKGPAIKSDTNSGSIESLLFGGLLYRLINEQEDMRNAPTIVDYLAKKDDALDTDTKIKTFENAIKNYDQMRMRENVAAKLESFFEDSRYNLIFIDKDFNHIINNKKSNKLVDLLFEENSPRKLKSNFIKAIVNTRKKSLKKCQKITSIPNAIDGKISLHIISNSRSREEDFDILLIPNIEDQTFQLENSIIESYKLTKKETLIINSLASGLDLKQISERSSTSLHTIRSHLKSIYRKTDTKSQTDLIRLILKHESQYLGSYFEPSSDTHEIDISKSSDLFVKLNAGNRLCYREYGPKDGQPLIILHNILGSRFHIPYKHTEHLEKVNRRIIVPEKPGYGQSDIVENYTESWDQMLKEFVDYLEIEKFTLLGNVTGSASAVSFASKYPNYLDSVILTSPLFFNLKEQGLLLRDFAKYAAKLRRASEKLSHTAFRFWMKSMKSDVESSIKKMIKQFSGHNEVGALNDQNFINRHVLNFNESQRNDSNGSAQDAVYAFTPLNLNLSEIKIPFEIWIGENDAQISPESAKKICEPIPNTTFHVRNGYGEDIFYHLFEEIIQ